MFKIIESATGQVRYVASLDGLGDGWSSEEVDWPTLDMRKADKAAAIDARLAEAFLAGFTPASGPLAGHTLQVRDDTDRTNWLTSQAAYSAEIAAGNGELQKAVFRDAANVTVTVSYADGLDALLAMAAWGNALLQNSWALKNQVIASADAVTLGAIDITQGWPTG